MLTALLCVMFVSSLLFLGAYGGGRPWWRSWEGRALVTSALGWALVSGGFLVDENVRNVPHDVWVAVAAVAATAALLKLVILVRNWRS